MLLLSRLDTYFFNSFSHFTDLKHLIEIALGVHVWVTLMYSIATDNCRKKKKKEFDRHSISYIYSITRS